MKVDYLSDDVLKVLVDEGVMLGKLYEIDRRGDMVYFLEMGSVIHI